jgi:hypothetical protein
VLIVQSANVGAIVGIKGHTHPTRSDLSRNPLGVFLEFDDHTPYRPSELDVYGLSCFVTVAAENRLLSESPPVELMGIFALDLS